MQVDQILLFTLDILLKSEVSEFKFNFVFGLLFVDLLEVSQHDDWRTTFASESCLLLYFNVTEDLLLLFNSEGDTIRLEEVMKLRVGKRIVAAFLW